MEFKENPAIYIQIAEYVCEQILLKKWKLGEKDREYKRPCSEHGSKPQYGTKSL